MPIQKLGVIGGGQMGQGIAQVAAGAGLDVIIVDASQAQADAAVGKLKKTLDRLVEKAKLDGGTRDQILSRIRAAGSMAEVADRDFVIEAAPEQEALKLETFAALGRLLPAEAILSSNTSSISITKL